MNHGNASPEVPGRQFALQKRPKLAPISFSEIAQTDKPTAANLRLLSQQPQNLARRFVGWGLLVLAMSARLPAEPTQVESRGLSDRSTVIVGELGLPLGTPVEVEGVIVSVKGDRILGIPGAYFFYYRFAVDTVGGRKLIAAKNFSFQDEEDTRVSLIAQTEPELRKLLDICVEGDCAAEDIISREQADQYFRDYTKVRRKILVFESGRFFGRSRNLPGTIPASSAPEYHFETFLVLVGKVRPVAASLPKAMPPPKS